MQKTKQKRLEAKGWIVGTAANILALTFDERALIAKAHTRFNYPHFKKLIVNVTKNSSTRRVS